MKTDTVSLNDEEAVKEILVDTVKQLWSAVNNLTRLRPTKHERYRVSIFGSARAKPGSYAYEQVKHMAKELAEMNCDIITGGGPGLMQAANEGASQAQNKGSRSVGIRVDLPFEQDANAFVTEAYEHGTFFTRLHHFVLASDAFIVTPGGIGTILEAMMIWQLLQVQKLHGTPLIFTGNIWKGLLDWTRNTLVTPEYQLANPEDLNIPTLAENAEQAIALIKQRLPG